ncbi:MAG: gliding motility-associated C-terminal domain-containing protein [Flavobacteriales bacterium]|nr:gliding motility-associated C-terminal domain-containing protein [Flavobacteriales bacterium]
MKNWIFTCVVSMITAMSAWGQDVWMHPNAGQWDDRILYKIDLAEGDMFIEKDGFTFYLHDGKQLLGHNHDDHEGHNHEEEPADSMRVHSIQSKFSGSSWQGELELIDSSFFYRNYFIGNDPSKWKSNLYSYNHLRMKNFYDGIDLEMNGKDARFKYSLIVQPGVDASQVAFEYSGQFGLKVDEEGNLRIKNRFGEIIEKRPVAWVVSDHRKEKVEVEFKIEGETVHFFFPNGYDNSKKLVIDPDLTFSTFSGSTADNWGFTATPDDNGNLFGGGIVFGTGYPILTGAYDATFNGGQVDLGISKFNATGTNLFYSTYIGGSNAETPNSIVSAPNGDLFIFGLTSSSDFPMAGSPYDATFNGGPSTGGVGGDPINFSNGIDLYVARLSANGSSLMASTYVGGSGTDGKNSTGLLYNYGDQFRGDIVLDANNNVYVSSHTNSANFPSVQGGQSSLGGGQDAVAFKLSPNLNALLWSTYIGGSGDDTGNSIQVASNGDVYVAGGTASSNMPFPTGFDLAYGGGISDGYVARLNGANGSFIAGTYMGYNEYDQTYFVQLDIDDKVYVYGQSETSWPITAGCYGNANAGQFIRKYNGDLMSIDWTTMIGAGIGDVEISPTAFLVSDCYDIYLSGWGGTLNVSYGQASNSTSNGFPITPDAFQSVTNGSNFYIAVLDQDASALKYGTYMGGMNSSSNHVDGGTSRFDKSGRIYHAVCGSCGATVSDGFTTTPGVWSPTNPSNNCNMAAFKFELSTIEAVISNPTPIVCLPDPVIFNNNSSNGNAFFWDFGDNTTSTDVNPVHFYSGPGTYNVTLVVSDTNGCYSPDSTEFTVFIGDFQGGVVQPPGPVCPGEPYQLEAFGGTSYQWTPSQFLDDPTIATPTATVDQTTTFQVVVSDTCGVDTVSVTLEVYLGSATVSNDTSICIGNSVNLFATGGVDYLWSPSTFLDDPTSSTPVSTPTNSTSYTVSITTSNGCELTETVDIDVYFTPPNPVIPDSVFLCEGTSLDLQVSGADTYAWMPHPTISPVTGPNVTISPTSEMYYYCDFINACGALSDSVFASIIVPNVTAGNDTIICPGQTATLWVQGGQSYSWSPSSSLNNSFTSQVIAAPSSPTMYYATGVDEYGCADTDSVFVDLFPLAFIQTVPDVYAFYGDNVQLGATSSTPGTYVWSPSEYLSCVVCPDPIANPDQNYTYEVTYTDVNGCISADTVNIFYDPVLYVPNTFTPGNDPLSVNDLFFAQGGNIAAFKMEIFNRWGELIYTLESLNDTWDGTYNGAPCQDGTYTWKAIITDFQDEETVHVGHVNLLR